MNTQLKTFFVLSGLTLLATVVLFFALSAQEETITVSKQYAVERAEQWAQFHEQQALIWRARKQTYAEQKADSVQFPKGAIR